MQSSSLLSSSSASACRPASSRAAPALKQLRKISPPTTTMSTTTTRTTTNVSTNALTPEQGALAASVALLGIANQAMAIGVMKARKRCGVEFPDLYAKESNPKKSEFDAVQRGHQNVLENIPIFLAVQACVAVAAGPVVAAGFIAVWTVAKWVYFDGYAKGGPKGRIPGAAVSNLVQLISTIVVLVVGVKAAVKLLPL